jgi:hypothetical protein
MADLATEVNVIAIVSLTVRLVDTIGVALATRNSSMKSHGYELRLRPGASKDKELYLKSLTRLMPRHPVVTFQRYQPAARTEFKSSSLYGTHRRNHSTQLIHSIKSQDR